MFNANILEVKRVEDEIIVSVEFKDIDTEVIFKTYRFKDVNDVQMRIDDTLKTEVQRIAMLKNEEENMQLELQGIIKTYEVTEVTQ